ncbi:MAG: ankyrin repeat domain-containing protein [Candidatus Margulisbacteria bacterium]|nr:ankyrin repeat domain-containing protein [Candidatus Margulisiibacteriota bacterium]
MFNKLIAIGVNDDLQKFLDEECNLSQITGGNLSDQDLRNFIGIALLLKRSGVNLDELVLKIESFNQNRTIKPELRKQLLLLQEKKNIFTGENAQTLLQDLLDVKKEGKDLCLLLNEFTDIDFFSLLNEEAELEDTDSLQRAKKSVAVCLQQLNNENQKNVLSRLARDFGILGFQNICVVEKSYELGKELLKAIFNKQYDEAADLILRGADPDYKNPGISGFNSLMLAAWNGQNKLVALLIANGADVNEKGYTDEGWTAMHAAAFHDQPLVIRELIKGGADVNDRTKSLKTPLIKAAEKGFLETVKELVTLNADLDAKDEKGQTALMKACEGGHMEIVDYLLGKDAFLEAEDNEGNTPFNMAVIKGHKEIVKKLISRVSDINYQNYAGETALQLARKHRSGEIIEIIKRAGGR